MSFILNRTTGSASGSVSTLTGNSGGAVGPTAGNITIVGSGVIDVTGNPGTSTLTISGGAAVAIQFDEDSGSAVPSLGVLQVLGSHGVNTTGAADTITILVDNTLTLGDLAPVASGSDSLTLTTGDLSVVSGNLNLPTTSDANNGVVEVNSDRFIHSYGTNNLFVGSLAGNFSLTTQKSTGIGSNALAAVTSGQACTAVGNNALAAVTDGGSNTAVGSNAGLSINGGDRNVAVGTAALNTITTGADNIALGYAAGSSYATGDSNNISIGNIGVVADSGRIRIGTSGTHTSAFFAGIEGVNVGNVAEVVTIDSDELGSAVITAGAGISITPTANTITITNTGAGGVFAWSVITLDQTAVVNNGYICDKAGTLALLLPATAAIGDVIRVTGINTATGWQITQSANQQIFFGTTQTTLGIAGSITSINIRDSIEMVCVVAGASTVWNVIASVGNMTIV